MRDGRSRMGWRIGLEPLESRRLLDASSMVQAAMAQVTSMPAGPAVVASISLPTTSTFATATSTQVATTPVASTSTVQASATSPTSRTVFAGGSTFTIALAGSGHVLAKRERGGTSVMLIGTDAASVLTISQTKATHASRGVPMVLSRLNVRTGALGGIDAPLVVLNGPTRGLNNLIATVSFSGIGPKGTLQLVSAKTVSVGNIKGRLFADGGIDTLNTGSITRAMVIDGSVGTLNAAAITGNVGVGGRVTNFVAGDVSGTVQVGSLGEAMLGTVRGSLIITAGASSLSTGNITGAISVGGSVSSLTATGVSGVVEIGGDLGTSSLGVVALGPGDVFHVAGDTTGAMTITQALLAGGAFTVDRDMLGDVTIQGNLEISAGSAFVVRRNLARLSISGNLDTSAGGTVTVGSNLESLNVVGIFRGHDDRDLTIGLNLRGLTVLGGAPNAGGIDHADIDVVKNLENVNISQGVYNSRITVGVDIIGGTTIDGYNIGPDGPVAVYNSTITAGVAITNFLISGDVKSDLPSNPLGRPTRIVAGVDRAGVYRPGGILNEFQITGYLIDAVLAASVAPFPLLGKGAEYIRNGQGDGGFDTYDAPGGTISGSPDGTIILTFPNFTAPPFDTTIDDTVLPGASINQSYAPSMSQTPRSFPTTPTIFGGVISTTTSDQYDHAGIFAAYTSGVFVGAVPT